MDSVALQFADMPFEDAVALLDATDPSCDMLPYNANIQPQLCYHFVSAQPSVIIDVRTDAEWHYVGGVDVLDTQAVCAQISWNLYPDYSRNPQFLPMLHHYCPDKDAALFFICKVGGRSAQAAACAASEGYTYCYNITHGFEGDHNDRMQRGCVNGWKAEGLPWMQS